ncbi:unnamed protein product, partial [Laminaria digitata]
VTITNDDSDESPYNFRLQGTGTVGGPPPTVRIIGVPATSNGPFPAVFTFSEDVTGFVAGDITVGNGAVSAFTAVSASVYSALITRATDGDVTIDVGVGVAQNGALLGNTAAVQAISRFDGTAPSVIAFERYNPAQETTDADVLQFRATFSEDMRRVRTHDFQVSGSTAFVTSISSVGASIYLITVAGNDLPGFNGVVGLDLAAGHGITDLAGNPLTGGEPATDETYTLVNGA